MSLSLPKSLLKKKLRTFLAMSLHQKTLQNISEVKILCKNTGENGFHINLYFQLIGYSFVCAEGRSNVIKIPSSGRQEPANRPTKMDVLKVQKTVSWMKHFA